jgi:hypothetical protein
MPFSDIDLERMACPAGGAAWMGLAGGAEAMVLMAAAGVGFAARTEGLRQER